MADGQLSEQLAQHKGAALAIAAAAVLAFMARRSHGGGDLGAPAATASYPAAGGTYDSTANDVFNAIEPILENLSSQLGQLGATAGPTPAPTGTAPAAPAGPFRVFRPINMPRPILVPGAPTPRPGVFRPIVRPVTIAQ